MTIDLDTITLTTGQHANPAQGTCVMEAASMLAGEPFTDHPACVSPVIGALLRRWNDQLDDTTRQDLKRYIPLIVNTAGTPEQETRRAWMATDWLIRVQTPAWLRLAGLTVQAELLADLAEVDPDTCPKMMPVIKAVGVDARAARAAASEAAWDAAWAATRDAASEAAWDAARAAAGDAARAAMAVRLWQYLDGVVTPETLRPVYEAHDWLNPEATR